MPDNPELQAALERARHHVMTPAERDAQRRSWVRGEMMLERPEMTADEVNALMDREALPHLAAPADVAELVARFRAGEPCETLCKVMDARSGCICAETADKLTAIAAERDEHKRTAERLDVKLFAFTGRALKGEAERDALAERLRVAIVDLSQGIKETDLYGVVPRVIAALTQASAPETGDAS